MVVVSSQAAEDCLFNLACLGCSFGELLGVEEKLKLLLLAPYCRRRLRGELLNAPPLVVDIWRLLRLGDAIGDCILAQV